MQGDENRIFLRLDRALATSKWSEQFRDMKVFHLVDSTSDHCALLVADPKSKRKPKIRHFHFEAQWTKREECKAIVKATWGSRADFSTPTGIMQNLKSCAAELSKWSTLVYGQIPKKI